MKKILIYAYTEFNLGDDLFIKVLCERYPDTPFAILAPGKYKLSFKDLKNLRVYASDSIWIRGINFLFKKIKQPDFMQRFLVKHSDGIVHIGGSIFMQGEYWKEYFHKAESIRNPSKPYFLLGANFGPFTDNEYYQTHKELFAQYTDICFREKYSYQLFEDLRNVRLAPDIIFQLTPPKEQAKENYVAISVIKPSSKGLGSYDLLYYEKMKDVAMYCIQQGFEVHFLSFCEHEGDHEAIEHIVNRLPQEFVGRTRTHLFTTNMEEILSVLAGSSFVVASRFHAMILGWVYEKPVFPIAYSNKMVNVMQDAGFTGLYTDFKGLEDLQPEQVFNSFHTNGIDVSKQVIEAERHFEKLDSYLSLLGRRTYESQTEYS
ncbi:polysaccharide pyruvyl transferase family protein [Paenibacillus wynnii]|uniref:Polysaccharide pyruvyl transferase domain-containing protein n=1 Tax=Paenibacillus wynnii TaxID=268407 RepID=A0A098MB30_9BACL|nr:polysaccharide pyruvyl transferase family protein [Paenibacillus wynnii]KGE19755.1 hypothetical protein PWYN_10700 [Paenibacillus wynnii]